MTIIEVALACVAFVAWTALMIISAMLGFKILALVNARLSPQDQFKPYGWWFGKSVRLWREYRRLYPEGTLYRTKTLLAVGATAMLFVMVWLLFRLQS